MRSLSAIIHTPFAILNAAERASPFPTTSPQLVGNRLACSACSSQSKLHRRKLIQASRRSLFDLRRPFQHKSHRRRPTQASRRSLRPPAVFDASLNKPACAGGTSTKVWKGPACATIQTGLFRNKPACAGGTSTKGWKGPACATIQTGLFRNKPACAGSTSTKGWKGPACLTIQTGLFRNKKEPAPDRAKRGQNTGQGRSPCRRRHPRQPPRYAALTRSSASTSAAGPDMVI